MHNKLRSADGTRILLIQDPCGPNMDHGPRRIWACPLLALRNMLLSCSFVPNRVDALPDPMEESPVFQISSAISVIRRWQGGAVLDSLRSTHMADFVESGIHPDGWVALAETCCHYKTHGGVFIRCAGCQLLHHTYSRLPDVLCTLNNADFLAALGKRWLSHATLFC